MNFSKCLGLTVAVGVLASAVSVANVFAGEPTFKVGTPIDVTTNKEVTEFTAGQVIEVPIDIENVDSGKVSSFQTEIYYDNTIFTAGATTANATSYYKAHKEYLYRSNGTIIGRHNMKYEDTELEEWVSVGSLTGYPAASDDSMTLTWSIDDENLANINDDEPELYALFTVNNDYVAPTTLNYGSSSFGDGLFNLAVYKVYENTSGDANRHANISGTQNDMKLNACAGAVKLNIDTANLSKWVQHLYVSIDGGAQKSVDELVNNEDGTYSLPVRIISSNTGSHTVAFYADLADTEDGAAENVKVGETTVTLDSPTSYTAVDYAN